MRRISSTFLGIILLSSSFQSFCQPGSDSITACYSRTNTEDFLSDVIPSGSSRSFAYEYYIELLDQQTPIDLEFNKEVKEYIDLFLTKRQSDLELSLQRAQFYFPIIEEMLDKYDLPLELKYIAVVESGLNPFAKSTSGAVGLWQFLYNTCSLFELKVDSYIDERRDPYKSTDAACRYLQYLYSTFNDWNLVMASYNGGPRDVRNAIQRSGGKTDYWELRPYLSEQAQNYVPAFIAMNYLMKYHQLHGIKAEKPEYPYQETDTLQIHYAISFGQISSILNVPVTELEKLNPIYRKKYIPDIQEPCILVLPRNLISKFLKYESQIIGYSIPETNYNTLLAHAGSTENRTNITHIVRPGEYFHKIALNYNCTVENIKAWNSLGDSPLYPGQSIEIWIEKKENLKQLNFY